MKRKVVILGGGCGALSAAFALTDRAQDREKFDVVVYQPGWRLGGKGASGRNVELGSRIEEHGLHIWSGFYENAFWLMRRCYRELDRPASAPMANVFAAFRPRHYTAMGAQSQEGWDVWKGSMPHEAGLPGDSISPGEYRMVEAPLTPWEMLSGLVPWAMRYLQATTGTTGGDQVEAIDSGRWWLPAVIRGNKDQLSNAKANLLSAADLLFLGQFGVRFAWRFSRAERHHETYPPPCESTATPRPYLALARTCRCLQRWAQDKRQGLGRRSPLNHRALFELIDLFATVLIGMLSDNVIERGFDAISGEDFAAWMRKHGAMGDTLAGPLITAFYCYVFAYEDGDPGQPRIAAGTALRFAFRLILCSRGGVFWEMATGMGDAVFMPLFEVLRRREVRFEFFHRVSQLCTAGGDRVNSIVLERQVRTKGDLPYEPQIDVGRLPCWPSMPIVDKLDVSPEQAQHMLEHRRALESDQRPWPGATQITLLAGEHFDHVILATSIAPLSDIAPQLLQHDPRLRRCVESVKTVATLGVQLWTVPTTAELGWRSPAPVLTAFGKPLDTWADMTQVLASEAWPSASPRSVQYFCGALSDAAVREAVSPRAAAVDLAARWMNTYAHELFPQGMATPTPDLALPFASDVLHNALRPGVPWDQSQWVTANVEPSERYVLSLPGTVDVRLRADETRYKNLALAGDWLRTGLDYGCVESAVIGGLQAARAVCGYPAVIHGERDFQSPS